MQLMKNTHITHKERNFRYGGHQNVNSFDPAPNFRLTLGRTDFFVPGEIELRYDKF